MCARVRQCVDFITSAVLRWGESEFSFTKAYGGASSLRIALLYRQFDQRNFLCLAARQVEKVIS